MHMKHKSTKTTVVSKMKISEKCNCIKEDNVKIAKTNEKNVTKKCPKVQR